MSTGNTGGYTFLPEGQTIYNSTDLCHNILPSFASTITGTVYAIQAYGGFQTTRTFDNIVRLPETLIAQFDTTGALEVVIPCSAFNTKLGIVKQDGVVVNNASRPYYDISTNVLYTDSVMLSAEEFVNYMRPDVSGVAHNAAATVVSVGTFSTLYTDFNLYIAQYFGFSNGNFPAGSEWGFGTLFSGELQFSHGQANDGVFDASAFCNLLQNNVTSDASGGYQTSLTGSLTVTGITQLLRNAVDADPFNNRNPRSPFIASDQHDYRDYGVTDGFYPNDLFFIPNNGFQIALQVNIDQEAFTNPLNNVNNPASGIGSSALGNATTRTTPTQANGVTNVIDNTGNPNLTSGLTNAGQSLNFLDNSGVIQTTTGPAQNGSIVQTTTVTSARTVSTSLLQRVVQAPLLIRLGATAGVDISDNFLTASGLNATGVTTWYYDAQALPNGGNMVHG